MRNKCWNHVEQKLQTREGPMYFVGGTLCVDFEDGGVGMNLDGKGFVYNSKNLPYMKNSQVYLPDYISRLVREVYYEVNGATNYFTEVVLGERSHA